MTSQPTAKHPDARTLERLSGELRRQADEVDELADAVEQWGEVGNRQASAALPLLERAQRLTGNAERFARNFFIGHDTKISFMNEASIALGASDHDLRGRGDLGYELMHAISTMEKYGPYTELANCKVKASSMRVHAANCRVVASLVDRLTNGEIQRMA